LNGYQLTPEQIRQAQMIAAMTNQQMSPQAPQQAPQMPQQTPQMPQQAPQMPQQAPQQQGLLSRLGSGISNYLSDPENRARLAAGFNTMRLNPDPNIAAMAQSRIESSQQQKLLKSQANKTAAVLRAQGQAEIADMIEQNPEMALEITKAFYANQFKSPSVFQQKIDAAKKLGLTDEQAFERAMSGGGTTQYARNDTINMPGGAETEIYKTAIQKDYALAEEAQKSLSSIQNLNQTIDLIESGNATLGIGSSFRQDIDRMKAFFGDEDAIKSASSTALLNALLGQDVFGAISSLGIGARGLDTPAEREFLRSVLTGTTEMTPEALLRMTNLRKKYAEKVIEKYNTAVNKGQFEYMGENFQNRFAPIDYTPSYLLNRPSGVPESTWSKMSEREKRQAVELFSNGAN
jgi:hypothetical protein